MFDLWIFSFLQSQILGFLIPDSQSSGERQAWAEWKLFVPYSIFWSFEQDLRSNILLLVDNKNWILGGSFSFVRKPSCDHEKI